MVMDKFDIWLENNKDFIDEQEYNFIKLFKRTEEGKSPRGIMLIGYYMQMLDAAGSLNDDINLYKQFAISICNKYNFNNKNILDVACGKYPNLSTHINDIYKDSNIMAIDPITKRDKVIRPYVNLKKESFTSDINGYDVIVSLFPCTITKDIIKASLIKDKDFYVGLCDCGTLNPISARPAEEKGTYYDVYDKADVILKELYDEGFKDVDYYDCEESYIDIPVLKKKCR